MVRRLLAVVVAVVFLAACSAAPQTSQPGGTGSSGTSAAPGTAGGGSSPTTGPGGAAPATARDGKPFVAAEVARFDEPWALAFLPESDHLVITERSGDMHVRNTATNRTVKVDGVPRVVDSGQGGLGDIIPGPTYTTDQTVYLSWAEAGDGGTGAAVGRARLNITDDAARLEDVQVIWRQTPKVSGSGHFSHRLVFSPDGKYLFISSGDRQKMDPAQDLSNTLGTIVRLNPDGSPAAGNPFADRGGVSDQIWSYGHRNPLGLAFDAEGNLWSSEMGPQGGDEINLILEGRNYGWPKASNGSHYGGGDIPDHRAGDGFEAPKVGWTPSISPGSLMIYSGKLFPQWKGDAFVGALSGQALIRVDLNGTEATKGDQWGMGQRIRAVAEAPDGAIWLLEDTPGGRMLRLTPPG